MKLFTFYLIICSLMLSSCRKEQGVNFEKSPYYFYSEDSSKILYDINRGIASVIDKAIYKEVTTDIDNFSVLSKEYGKDSKYIYYTFIRLKNVDYSSFYWDDSNNLPKDKEHVYYPMTDDGNLKIIRYADPSSYQKVSSDNICEGWFRDKNHYFYNHAKTDADIASLSFKSPYLPFDKKFVFSVDKGKLHKRVYRDSITLITSHLLRDSHKYFFKADCDSISYEISYRDSTKFEYYDKSYHIFRIDDKIYFMGVVIASGQVDTNSFEILNYNYSKDKNYIYYKNECLKDIDTSTFEVLSEEYSKDKNYVYVSGNILKGYEPINFKKDKWGRFPCDNDYRVDPSTKKQDYN